MDAEQKETGAHSKQVENQAVVKRKDKKEIEGKKKVAKKEKQI